jgi:putative membrane protein
MQLLKNAFGVAKLEGVLFRHFPKLRISVAGIILIPALYAFIYLMSVWDPASRTSELPAAIVNQDVGTVVNGQKVNIGADLKRSLQEKNTFGFYEAVSESEARRSVREGKALFALIIPANFSANAMAASEAGADKLIVFASEGNNYSGAGFAKRFAGELGHQVNETLNEKRWAAVLGATASSADSLTRLRQGVAKLRDGTRTLDAGLKQANDGSSKLAAGAVSISDNVTLLTEGVKQLGAGARTLDEKKPATADLQALKAGAAQLAEGQGELQRGMPQLEEGSRKLMQGASQLRDQSKSIPIVGDKISTAAGQLSDGAGQLQGGLKTAGEATTKLAAGAQSLNKGVSQLADGFAAYGAGVSTLASKIPADAKLDELSKGSRTLAGASGQLHSGLDQLKAGSSQLAAGVDTLASALPAGVPELAGSAEGLANTVEPAMEIDAPVKNNGIGFAPNFIPVALWLGAVMTAFIFHLRRLPLAAAGLSRPALLLGKMGILGAITTAQALCVFLMASFILDLQPVHSLGLVLIMLAGSLTFMLLILALVRSFGDAGKALALILLILQLSSAGGVVPIELTNDFYRTVSPWLPFTWVVKGVRASAFGAFNSEWLSVLGVEVVFASVAFLIATYVGRWKFVDEKEHRPAMDI